MPSCTEHIELYVAGQGVDLEATVSYEYERACRGARERGTGLQLEPDYPAQVHILSVDVQGVDITKWLDDDAILSLADRVLAEVEEGRQCDADEYADMRRERELEN